MDYNLLRNYNEVVNNGIFPTEKYELKKIPIISEEDKEACLRLLTIGNKHLLICHNCVSSDFINSTIEESDYLIYFHRKSSADNIVAFALIKFMKKSKGKILNILLACAVKSENKFGYMIANALYNFAIDRGIMFLYTSPRTDMLRVTFMKYGFEPIFGKKDVNEVLEKTINAKRLKIYPNSKTRKSIRRQSAPKNMEIL